MNGTRLVEKENSLFAGYLDSIQYRPILRGSSRKSVVGGTAVHLHFRAVIIQVHALYKISSRHWYASVNRGHQADVDLYLINPAIMSKLLPSGCKSINGLDPPYPPYPHPP